MELLSPLKTVCAALALACALPASAAVINFDDVEAPMFFGGAPLSNEYAALGVSFSGATGTGGSLIDQGAELGFMARSGANFLGFNSYDGFGVDQRISFAADQSAVSIFTATYEAELGPVSFTLNAFDAGGALLGTTTIEGTRDWKELAFVGAGIRSVTVSSSAGIWGLDDLNTSVSPVPEPATYAMFGAGLALMFAARRKRVQ